LVVDGFATNVAVVEISKSPQVGFEV
jgi:hypothetical protein